MQFTILNIIDEIQANDAAQSRPVRMRSCMRFDSVLLLKSFKYLFLFLNYTRKSLNSENKSFQFI